MSGEFPNDPFHAQATGSSLRSKRQLGKYELLRPLGRGGMGEVWLALDTVAGVEVAIKLLPPELRYNEEAQEQIRESYRRVHKLWHPNICAVKDLVLDSGAGFFLVMDYFDGITLSKYRSQYVGKHGTFPASEVVKLLTPVAMALDHAHSVGLAHRDIKPANILVSRDGEEVRLIDFQLAAEIRSTVSHYSNFQVDTSGTYPYMAPEQVHGQRANAQSDQYALAMVAYELFAGQLPFDAVSWDQWSSLVNNENVAIPHIDSVTEDAQAGLGRGLSRNPKHRPANCAALVSSLLPRQKVFSTSDLTLELLGRSEPTLNIHDSLTIAGAPPQALPPVDLSRLAERQGIGPIPSGVSLATQPPKRDAPPSSTVEAFSQTNLSTQRLNVPVPPSYETTRASSVPQKELVRSHPTLSFRNRYTRLGLIGMFNTMLIATIALLEIYSVRHLCSIDEYRYYDTALKTYCLLFIYVIFSTCLGLLITLGMYRANKGLLGQSQSQPNILAVAAVRALAPTPLCLMYFPATRYLVNLTAVLIFCILAFVTVFVCIRVEEIIAGYASRKPSILRRILIPLVTCAAAVPMICVSIIIARFIFSDDYDTSFQYTAPVFNAAIAAGYACGFHANRDTFEERARVHMQDK